ncbi:antibiotic biosynthesis monooxygenase [Brevundimonas sp. TSRC1-1]|uniref:antibiotic biosynthesis monooxygenase n=1 Tax=Brevundimonas sp. TSRC1-1 TaxID=2804562 RepID=UPI003CF7DB4E
MAAPVYLNGAVDLGRSLLRRPMSFPAHFTPGPVPTVFIVNVIHAHPGRQDEAFAIIQDVVRYVAERKPGFLWSNLAKSTDGLTVVNIEAIADEGNVGEFFADPVFVEKFKRLDAVSTSEFHTYRVTDLVLPGAVAA